MSLDIAFGTKIAIRVSRRARRLTLVSGINGVEAIVPPNYSTNDLESFVSAKRDWIIKTSRYYRDLKDRCGWIEPDTIYFLGDKYRFHVVKDKQQSVVVSSALKVITFHATDQRRYKQEKLKWYKNETTRIIAKRLPALAGRLNLRYNKVSIRNQRSRWGSCSRKGNLNFNLLLAAAPPQVIDYVIIHELMHLIELNHSPRFWKRVREADPECNKHKEWLAIYAPVIQIG